MGKLKIYPVESERFRRYGRVVAGFDCSGLLERLNGTPLPKDGTVYEPSAAELEQTEAFAQLRDRAYGGLPIQIGYCNGNNAKLNALEYHRSSEFNAAGTDLILLLGALQDVDPVSYSYDTSLVEAFLVPAGTLVELYATTLHYAPCNAARGGFRDAIVLPKGTNLPLEAKPGKDGEDRLLFARNKWLIAHPEAGLRGEGAFEGLTGENLSVESFNQTDRE